MSNYKSKSSSRTSINTTLEAMKKAKRWLLWREAGGGSGEKPRKVPVYANGKNRSKTDTPEDLKQLVTYQDAVVAQLESSRYAGLGFALGKDGEGYWQGVDLDDVDKNDTEWVVLALRGYVETSPSGNGVHAIGFGPEFKALGSNKSGVEAYCKGRYFTVTEKELRDDPLVSLHEFISETLAPIHAGGSAKSKTPAVSSDNDEVDADTIEKLRDALKHLDSDEYHTWIRYGLALKLLGNDGLALWLEWSGESKKYDESQAKKTWKSFKPTEITFRSIFFDAQEAGWVNTGTRSGKHTSGDSRPLEREAEIPLKEMLENCVFIAHGDRVADLRKAGGGRVLKRTEFNNLHAGQRFLRDKKSIKAADLWLMDKKRQSALDTTFRPTEGGIVEDRHGEKYVNTYVAPSFPETEKTDKLGVFKKHMKYLIPIKEEREWFISWIAFSIQHPVKRCKVTPLHVSVPHGTGRGWVVNLLSELIGHLKKVNMPKLAQRNFNEYMDESLIVVIEEVKEGDRRFSVADEIRDQLTEDVQRIELKGKTAINQRVFCNFFFMSNHRDALVLPPEDRRINVLSGPDKPESPEYYDRLYEWLEDSEGLAQLYRWLQRRDLKKFNYKTSMATMGRDHMVDAGQSTLDTMVLDFLKNPPYPAMSTNQIIEKLLKESDEDDIEKKQLQRILGKHRGGVHRLSRIGDNGKQPHVWILCDNLKSGEKKKMRESYLAAEKELSAKSTKY